MSSRTTQVGIIGAGPAGLMLGHLLRAEGVDAVVIERQSRARVLERIRAGVLERTTTDLLHRLGVDAGLNARGLPHHGFALADGERVVRIDIAALTGHHVTVYGQTEVTRDLLDAADARGLPILWESPVARIDDLEGVRPAIVHGDGERLECDFIAACDGFHGAGRRAIPDGVRREFERAYPFGWLGVLADVPPCDDELIYAGHDRGFALASMRSPTRSRYYVQVGLEERIEEWSDERFWDELALRLGPDVAAGLAGYGARALARVWKAERFSWYLTKLMHRFPEDGAFERRMQIAELDYIAGSEAARTSIAENYVGLPL